MHTKREMVSTGLPDAMLNSSTVLAMTQMAQSGTASWGIPALVGAVQLANNQPTYIGTFTLHLPPEANFYICTLYILKVFEL